MVYDNDNWLNVSLERCTISSLQVVAGSVAVVNDNDNDVVNENDIFSLTITVTVTKTTANNDN